MGVLTVAVIFACGLVALALVARRCPEIRDEDLVDGPVWTIAVWCWWLEVEIRAALAAAGSPNTGSGDATIGSDNRSGPGGSLQLPPARDEALTRRDPHGSR